MFAETATTNPRERGLWCKVSGMLYHPILRFLFPRSRTQANAGPRVKFDDFVVVHIQQTLEIHYSGIFPPWHRWFVFQYEKALREECGYKGYQPVSFHGSVQLPFGETLD